jgi:formylglycine-generating enzyme required for sulfatase activity
MGATPVTVAVWKEYCDAAGTPPPKKPKWDVLPNHPVVYVSWNDIMGESGFCAWARRVSGINLSIPTEAQFEYAARFSTNNKQYPWPGAYNDSKLWSSVRVKRSSPLPVIRESNIYQNGHGLSDMAGNVYQWCYDLYDKYPSNPQDNPIGPSKGSEGKRCVRGGSWYTGNPADFRHSSRLRLSPDLRSPSVGFRLVANQ